MALVCSRPTRVPHAVCSTLGTRTFSEKSTGTASTLSANREDCRSVLIWDCSVFDAISSWRLSLNA
jgi:hypothetical protein